eukprot:scaffold122055_cov22-Prasinocladus_malaysianus.AAC.1
MSLPPQRRSSGARRHFISTFSARMKTLPNCTSSNFPASFSVVFVGNTFADGSRFPDYLEVGSWDGKLRPHSTAPYRTGTNSVCWIRSRPYR